LAKAEKLFSHATCQLGYNQCLLIKVALLKNFRRLKSCTICNEDRHMLSFLDQSRPLGHAKSNHYASVRASSMGHLASIIISKNRRDSKICKRSHMAITTNPLGKITVIRLFLAVINLDRNNEVPSFTITKIGRVFHNLQNRWLRVIQGHWKLCSLESSFQCSTQILSPFCMVYAT